MQRQSLNAKRKEKMITCDERLKEDREWKKNISKGKQGLGRIRTKKAEKTKK